MEKFFNTEGPMKADMHYLIPSFQRFDWEEVRVLIERQKYFLLHAPRQTGKTTALMEMVTALNQEGRYLALYVNIEAVQTARNDADKGNRIICDILLQSGELFFSEPLPWSEARDKLRPTEPQQRLNQLLSWWAKHSSKPIVLLLDEVDALIGDTLVSLLRQLRTGYMQRPEAFPHSIILCGVRDLKDYRIHQSNGDIITGGSAFNVKAESLTLGNFTPQEVRALYQQHTDVTGQRFDEAIFEPLWQDTYGQPWLVNAIGNELTWKDRALRDRSVVINLHHYQAARERLIQSRAVHLDQLADKLQEERVRGVIAPILAGEGMPDHLPQDDLLYCHDLGLIRIKPTLQISNRIYQEVIPRELTFTTQATISNQQQSWYLTETNRLDMVKLLQAFQQFFRQNSEIWLQRFAYKEAGPQLLMQAFLQRIINGGGRINREYALGRRRTDLLIEWPVSEHNGQWQEVQIVVIELKILHGSLEKIVEEGIAQTLDYSDKCGAEESHLVIFDRDATTSWEEKIWHWPCRLVSVWGC
ncbi:ATP-binding protein [Ectothiorhodospiraceae bacterium BW-2]|nr:ATP-binding protein [Ectothiorhodospiraceae bacterium BW-2]